MKPTHILAAIALVAFACSAQAATQVWTCSIAGLQSNAPPGVYSAKTPDNSLIIVTAATNTGAPGTGLCQLASVTPAGMFTRVTQDGSTYSWATLASIGLGVAAPITPDTVTISWAPPTAYTDGTPITEAITYNVYRGASATTMTLRQAGATTPWTETKVPAGTYFYTVTALTSGGESVKPDPQNTTITAPKLIPGPPKSISVTVTVTVPGQ